MPLKTRITPKARTRELTSLQEQLRKPVTAASLTNWASESVYRSRLLDNTVWGSIRWSKSLGKPLGPALASGFSIVHKFQFHHWYIAADGTIVDKYHWSQAQPPSVWDGPADDTYYWVSYLMYASREGRNEIQVGFSNTGWSRGGLIAERGYRQIQPAGFSFDPTNGVIVLAEQEVIEVPSQIGRAFQLSWTAG